MANTRPKQPKGKTNEVKPQYEEQHNMHLSNKACNIKMRYTKAYRNTLNTGAQETTHSWGNHIHKTNQQLEEQGSQKQLDSRRYRTRRTTPRLEVSSLQKQHTAGYQNRSGH
ncbi:hypothetical protein F511_47332 [Dorcoceras hygrometricum]|uniref:Uncharacterized protein n=1 Tax=Dorcoceras hygrometricum TaxID=472368 RepID=A0A2Z6ZRA3_9LAMI|nr:hypothetical protein F511_47332 [Dorcoceras hygrometricum]